MNLATQGAALISVAVIDAMGSEAILVRPDSGVKTIADLKGKALLTTSNAGVNTFFPIVLANSGLVEGDITLTNVPDGALPATCRVRAVQWGCWAADSPEFLRYTRSIQENFRSYGVL